MLVCGQQISSRLPPETRSIQASPSRQIAKQISASEPLGGATTALGADKEPSPTPAALAGRRKGGESWTVDE
jgi:hypothetical protein